MRGSFVTNLLISVVASLVSGAILALANKYIDASMRLKLLALTVVATVLFFVFRALYQRVVESVVRPKIKAEVETEVRNDVVASFEEELISKVGLAEIYPNFPACERDLKQEIATSRRVDVFVQIGKSVLSGNSNIYDYLRETKLASSARIRILHAHRNSTFLTERAAQERGSDVRSWRLDLRYTYDRAINLASNSDKNIEVREHQEGYLWRLFVFDECAFAQPYLHDRENSRQAPVLKWKRCQSGVEEEENLNSLYRVFSRYFELVWDKSAPHTVALRELVSDNSALAVVALALRKQKFVLAVPERYLINEDEILFHFPGGKADAEEDVGDALHREVLEETGCDITIKDCDRPTRYIIHATEAPALSIKDECRPRLVYRRNRRADRSDAEDAQWVLAYSVEFAGHGAPQPKGELAAILELTPEALKLAYDGELTLGALNRRQDGSTLRKRDGLVLDPKRRLTPTGVAQIVGASMHNGGVADWN